MSPRRSRRSGGPVSPQKTDWGSVLAQADAHTTDGVALTTTDDMLLLVGGQLPEVLGLREVRDPGLIGLRGLRLFFMSLVVMSFLRRMDLEGRGQLRKRDGVHRVVLEVQPLKINSVLTH